MPKPTPNYAESCVYKLCCKNPLITKIYVGSTTSFRNRKNQHKTACTNEKGRPYNRAVYKHIRANGGWDNWDMVEVAKVEATGKRDLERIERTYIESLAATLNCNIPTRSAKERYAKNRTAKIEYQKRLYRKNRTAKIEYQKELYRKNRTAKIECQKQYHRANKAKRLEDNKQVAEKERKVLGV